jgi:hypothetical protein
MKFNVKDANNDFGAWFITRKNAKEKAAAATSAK